jgi:tetratricopeptide (TPR) repeat protein
MGLKELLLSKDYLYCRQNGERLFHEGQYAESRIEYIKALDYLREMKTAEEQEIEQHLDVIAEKMVDENMRRARELKSQGNVSDSLSFYQNALGVVRQSDIRDEILIEMATVKSDSEDEKTAAETDSDKVASLLETAMQYALNHCYDAAVYHLTELVQMEPEFEEGWLRLGNACFDSDRLLDALSSYHKGLELDGNLKPSFCYRIGRLHYSGGDYRQAEQFFLKCLEYEPQHADCLKAMASMFRRICDRDRAIECYEKLISVDPDDMKTKLELASLWEESGYQKNAIELWDEVLKSDDEDAVDIARERLDLYL